jgi:hypothetical protein
VEVQGLAALRIRSVIMLCCSGVNNSSSHLGHRSTLTFFRIMSSYSKSTSISVYSTQHFGHIKAPAFTISPCLFWELFVTFSSRHPIENCQLIKTFSRFALSVFDMAVADAVVAKNVKVPHTLCPDKQFCCGNRKKIDENGKSLNNSPTNISSPKR